MNPNEQTLLCGFLQTSHEGTPAGRLEVAAALSGWLSARGFVTANEDVSADDVRRARHIRAALTSLFAGNNGMEIDPRTHAAFDELASVATMTFRAGENGRIELRSEAAGVSGFLLGLVQIVHRAELEGDYERLKACRKCRWPFFDASKNRSRTWCDMALCGAQEKSREYRKRKSASGG